jgi:hypothetical protein
MQIYAKEYHNFKTVFSKLNIKFSLSDEQEVVQALLKGTVQRYLTGVESGTSRSFKDILLDLIFSIYSVPSSERA